MTLTVKGGKSPHQNAAIRGRELIRQDRERKKGFESLRDGGNNPPPKLGPFLKTKRT